MNDLLTQSWTHSGNVSTPLLSVPENEVHSTPKTDSNFQHFNESVSSINDLIDKANGLLSEMQSNQASLELEGSSKKRKILQSKLELNAVSIDKCFRSLNKKLDLLKIDNANNRKHPGCHEGSPMDSLRLNITKGLVSRIKKLQENIADLKDKCEKNQRNVVERHIQILTGGPAKKEDVDKIVAEGTSESLFKVAVSEQGRGEAMNAILDIQQRSLAAADLRESLNELLGMFVQLDIYVKEQGQMIDLIDASVQNTSTVVDIAVSELGRAAVSRRRGVKWKFVLATLLLILTVLLLLFLVFLN